MRINNGLLEARRRELGMSARVLAQHANVSRTVIINLERTGEAGSLTVRTIHLIAQALSVTMSELFTEIYAETPCGAGSGEFGAEIGSALHRSGNGLAVAGLAEALGISSSVVHGA